MLSEGGAAPRFTLQRPAQPPPVEGELAEWYLDFASLFREHIGIDSEAHLDQNQARRAPMRF